MNVWLPAIRAGTGIDVYTERLAAALEGRSLRPRITWFPRSRELLPELLRAHTIPAGTDVVHGSTLTSLAFLGRGVPVVTTVHHLVHDPAFAPYRSVAQGLYHRIHLRWRERAAIRRSDAVTAVSRHAARCVTAFSGRTDIDVIENWVDVERYRPAPSVTPSADGAPLRLLWVGNPTRRKGADLLPALAERVAGHAVIRCTGGLRGDLFPTGIAAHVQPLGRLDDDALIAEYQACDALLSLSRYEGFGYTALEAMACGKPVVGFAAGGLAEVVQDGRTGRLVPVDDVDALAAAIIGLAGRRAEAAAWGRAGREVAVGFADRPDAYVDLYRRIVPGGAG